MHAARVDGDAVYPDLGKIVERLVEEAGQGQLSFYLASRIGALDSSTRLLVAQRLLSYVNDLLVRPVAPRAAHVLEAAHRQLRDAPSELA